MGSVTKNPEFAQCWGKASIVYNYLIGLGGRGISSIDASYYHGVIQFQMRYRPDGVKSHRRDKVSSQNSLEARISLGGCGTLVTGLFCS